MFDSEEGHSVLRGSQNGIVMYEPSVSLPDELFEALVARLGLAGVALSPSLAVLHLLVASFTDHIAYDNIGIVLGEAGCMHGQHANRTLHDILVLFDVPFTPFAHVTANQWTRPLVSVQLVMALVKIIIAILAVLGDTTRHGA